MWSRKKNVKTKSARPAETYTLQEAADLMGMNKTTLMDRVKDADHAHIRSGREDLEDLHKSYVKWNGKHFFEVKQFEKFKQKYLSRPEVQLSRELRINFSDNDVVWKVRSEGELEQVFSVLHTLLIADGELLVGTVVPRQ